MLRRKKKVKHRSLSLLPRKDKKKEKAKHIQSVKGALVQKKYNIVPLREQIRSTDQPVSWRTAVKFELSRVPVERKGLLSSSIMLSGPSVLWQPTVKKHTARHLSTMAVTTNRAPAVPHCQAVSRQNNWCRRPGRLKKKTPLMHSLLDQPPNLPYVHTQSIPVI